MFKDRLKTHWRMDFVVVEVALARNSLDEVRWMKWRRMGCSGLGRVGVA